MDALNGVLIVLNVALLVFQLRKEWHTRRPAEAHPLEPALRDIAQAIRGAVELGR
jgi:hypothetical protein